MISRFADPWWLLAAPLVLAAVFRFARRRRKGDARLLLPAAGARLALGRSPWELLDRGLPALRAVALLLLVVAAARPQSEARLETVTSLGVDIVLALDVSHSMQLEDFPPDHRLGAAKRTAEAFVGGRPRDRIGLVVFAQFASTRCPLTIEHEMLRRFLGEVRFAPRDQSATAIGSGLAAAVNRLRESEAESKVVVLLTDGENNAGRIQPLAAADAARALGVRVYTIGVGSEGAIRIGGQIYRDVLDEELLREIAEKTGGQYFRATDPQGLENVFATIDALERSEIETRERVLHHELFAWALFPALLLLGAERLVAFTRLRRIP